MKTGVLPDHMIEDLIRKGNIIRSSTPSLPGVHDNGDISTSSMDLKVGDHWWKLLGSFKPKPEENIESVLRSSKFVDTSCIEDKFYVDLAQLYMNRLVESLDLPKTVQARIFNKSGRGRVFVSLRGLTDNSDAFDIIRSGYNGHLYAEVHTTSFPLVVAAGQTAIPQIRFYLFY